MNGWRDIPFWRNISVSHVCYFINIITHGQLPATTIWRIWRKLWQITKKVSEPWKPLSDNELIQQSITGKQRRLSCINHNKLKSFLSCIKMLACQELPFRGYYEIEDNRGHFLARCGTVTEYSDCLRSRFRFCEEKCQMYMSSRLLYFREFYSFLSFSTFEVRCRKK